MVLRGIAFCPGHITGLFSIHDETELFLAKGSRGAGLSVSLGALVNTALYPPKETGRVGPIEVELQVKGVDQFHIDEWIYNQALKELLPDRGNGWRAVVKAVLQLPVGQGFGMSAAGALAMTISIWEAVHSGLPKWDRKLRFQGQQEMFFSRSSDEFKVRPIRTRVRSHLQLLSAAEKEAMPVKPFGKPSGMIDEKGVRPPKGWLQNSRAAAPTEMITYADCINAAHRIDVLRKGGLGDVIGAARGGVEIRMAPGVPPYGEIHTIPVSVDSVPRVVAGIVGPPLETRSVLMSPMKRERIQGAGEGALKRLIESPSTEHLMAESRQFSIESGLQSMQVRSALSETDRVTTASQIMLGNSVFALVGSKDRDRVQSIEGIWGRKGRVYTMDVDLFGARPVN